MKIHEYNEMMAYLLRPEMSAGESSREKFKRGTPLGFIRPEKLSFDDLNKDGEFKKFFKEYLEKKSKMEIAGRTRGSTLWPIIEEALKTVPKNASLKEKYNAIKNFDKRDSEYGYGRATGQDYKVGRRLGAAINLSFENAKKGLGQLNIKQLADAIPAYSYKTLQGIFGSAKKDQEKFTGNAKKNIINSKIFVNKLKDLGVEITQGDIEQRGAERLGSGKSYLYKPPDNIFSLKIFWKD